MTMTSSQALEAYDALEPGSSALQIAQVTDALAVSTREQQTRIAQLEAQLTIMHGRYLQLAQAIRSSAQYLLDQVRTVPFEGEPYWSQAAVEFLQADKWIHAIKELRAVNPGLGLADAKAAVDARRGVKQ